MSEDENNKRKKVTTKVKPHKRSNPKSPGTHKVSGHERTVGKKTQVDEPTRHGLTSKDIPTTAKGKKKVTNLDLEPEWEDIGSWIVNDIENDVEPERWEDTITQMANVCSKIRAEEKKTEPKKESKILEDGTKVEYIDLEPDWKDIGATIVRDIKYDNDPERWSETIEQMAEICGHYRREQKREESQ